MSLINNKFLSLTNQFQTQARTEIQEEKPEKKKKNEIQQQAAPVQSEEKTKQPKQLSTNINDDLLLTYRGININHIETAESKHSVTYNNNITINSAQTSSVHEVKPVQIEIKKEPKPATVSNSVVNSSSIATQYQNGTVREGQKGIKTPSKLESIIDMARADLNAVADAIKAQLKEEFGSEYNSKEVQNAIDAAIEQTLNIFQDNQEKRKASPGVNDRAFIFKRQSSFLPLKGSYTYNVQALTNTFLESYNSIATELFNDAQKAKDTGAVGNNVIINSDIYSSYSSNEKRTSSSFLKIKALYEAKEIARSDMEAISAEIKIQLKSELGTGYDDALVSASINEAIEMTINQFTQNSGNDVENSFVYKRKSMFKYTYSYNVMNLVDAFISNFNEINVGKFSNISPAINEEQKAEYTNKYASEMTREMLRANLEEALSSSSSTNTVDSQMLYIKESSTQELKETVGEKIDNTYALYEERFGSAFENKSELKSLFEEAKNSVLNSLNGKNKCNLGEISYEFQDKFFENINTNLWNKYQAENAAPHQAVTRNMFTTNTVSTFSAATRGVSSNNAGNVSVSTDNIKFQNGMIITDPKNYPATIDVTINNSDGTTTNIKVEVSPDLLVYKPVKENNNEVTVVDPFEEWNSKPLQERINEIAENLKQTFQNLPESVLKDFISEGTSITITPAGDDIYSSKNLGLFSPAINEIALTYGPGYGTGFLNGINVNTLTHEIGHSIDVQEGVYKSESSTTNMSSAYNDLLNALPESMRNNYALSNPKELFAEYYAYKNLGTSDHFIGIINEAKSKGLYDKIKPFIENIDKEFNSILKTDASLKEAQDKAQNGSYTNSELLDKIKQDWENGKIYTSDLVGDNWSDINDTWNLNMQTKDILAEYYKHYYLNEPSDLINRLNNATGNTKYGDSIKELWNEAVNGSQYSDGLKQTCEKFKESLAPAPNISPDYDDSADFPADDQIADNNPVELPTDNNDKFDEIEPDYTDDGNNIPGTDSSDSSSNTSGIPDDFNPQPDFSDNTQDSNNDNDFEVITGSIDNAGLDAGILPDINQDSSDGTGFDSSYSQEQLEQIRDYVHDQLQQQYGDGYQIDVSVDSSGNASYHIMPELDGSPSGDISGNSGLIDNDSKYDEYGYDKDGYDKDGFDQYGYDRDGYDEWGYDVNGYDRDGYDEWGYDINGYDENGYDIYGYNEWGYDANGYDVNGYDEWGYDQDGYDADGYDMDGFDRDGYNEWGYNMNGYDRDGYDEEGYDMNGYDRYGNTADDASNDEYISRLPGFGSQGTPIRDRYGNIIGYR